MMFAVALLLVRFQAVPPGIPANAVTPATASIVANVATPADATTPFASISSEPDKTRFKATNVVANDTNAATNTTKDKTAESSSNANHVNLDSHLAGDNNSQGKQPASLTAVSLDPGQKSSSFSTIRIPDPTPAKPYQIREVETMPSRRAWMVLSLVEHSAATFDAYATRQAVSRGAVELDPVVRPFAHSPGIYAALQVGPVLFDVLARHMQRSQYNIVRRTWWLPQSLSTATSIFAGAHDLNVSGRLKH